MDRSATPASVDGSRTGTPNPASSATPTTSRFTAQNATAEDLLKSQTVGLVHLSDYRKRRAEALEQKEREASSRHGSGASTPLTGASTPQQHAPTTSKKKRKTITKGKLSFALDDEDEEGAGGDVVKQKRDASATNPSPSKSPPSVSSPSNGHDLATTSKPRSTGLGPNSSVSFVPKARTKAALLREAQTRETLRKEFLAIQEAVRATDIAIPFVFYDGTNTPGGTCRVKKGDPIWLFLDKARKAGAEMAAVASSGGSGAARPGGGGSGLGETGRSRRDWARVSVDDLMLVRGEIIIPHHYDFHYFIVNKSVGFNGPLFPYAAEPTAQSPALASLSSDGAEKAGSDAGDASANPLTRPVGGRKRGKDAKASATLSAEELAAMEGSDDDPVVTKVVDRRWFERNKHIFPASIWEEFDPTKDYTKGIRKDQGGNTFFF